jgi:hypothetical protein
MQVPLRRDGCDEADRRTHPVTSGANRCLDGIVQGGRVLAPKRIRRGRRCVPGVELRRACPGGRPDGDELLGRPQPVPRKPYDVLLVAGRPVGIFGWTVARFHGFADLSYVRVPFRLPGEVQYNSELAPVCLN